MTAQTTTDESPLTVITVRYCVVPETFLSLENPPCAHCGAPLNPRDETRSYRPRRWETGSWRLSQSAMGEYVACEECGTRYIARDGAFVNHGDSKEMRYCAHCRVWRDAGQTGTNAEVEVCTLCMTRFDAPWDPNETVPAPSEEDEDEAPGD